MSNTSGASINIDSAHPQGKPPISGKPTLPAKPLHIRPGLKPVKIPTVDDKILVSLISELIVLVMQNFTNLIFSVPNVRCLSYFFTVTTSS